MNNAQVINRKFQSNSEQINIDYLCFTFALKNLTYCHKALGEPLEKGAHKQLRTEKQKGLLQRNVRAPKFPTPPQFNATLAHTSEDLQAYNDAFRHVYMNYLEECLRIFTNRVLGLSMSAPRGLGFQFYSDSMKLTSPNGEDFCGYIGIGGNNDTVHFQINGQGCKHLFSKMQPWALHDWLYNVLGVTTLARCDLAYDDFDGNFDCQYAEKAWYDDAYRTNARGRAPKLKPSHEIDRVEDGLPVYSQEMICVGSRTSRVYWRIYNKALEQNLAQTGLVWYRTEVELKKWSVDVLLNPSGAFAALCAFSASIATSEPFNTKPKPSKRAALDLLSSAYWMRRQYGKILTSLIEFHDGDISTVVGSLVRDNSKFTFPDTYGKLVNHILET